MKAVGDVVFVFNDTAGNTFTATKTLKVYGLENATVPNLWGSSVVCSPQTVDRQLGPLINQRVYCEVGLIKRSNTKSVSTVFIGPAACTGDSSILENVETLNTEAGSTSPIIKLTLRKDDYKIDKAGLSCSFDIFSKVDDSITQTPEIETAAINIQFYNLPLGEMSDDVKRKIKDAIDDAKGIWKIIGKLNTLFDYAMKICRVLDAI